jgi:hypothetical protein
MLPGTLNHETGPKVGLQLPTNERIPIHLALRHTRSTGRVFA